MKPEPELAVDSQRTVDLPAIADPSDTFDQTGALQATPPTHPTGNAPPDDAPKIPGYIITGEIARGGMGCVYSGRDLVLDREVAIKTLLPGANAERFVTESKITARLPHPGIPPVHTLGTLENGSPYLAMKLIRGDTLADLLRERSSPMENLSRFVQIFEQIAQAVGFAHAQGIIHRDLKPLNVMVGAFGEVQVMDWGLAKDVACREIEQAQEHLEGIEVIHTAAGVVMGTPGYMAPEQARGELVLASADVFALGATLAVVLTGKPAFVGTNAKETIAKAAESDLADVLSRLAACGADGELIDLAKRCMAAQANERPANAQAVAEEVAQYRAGVDARLRKAETDAAEALVREAEQRKRRRAIQLAGGTIAIVLLSGLTASLWQMRRAVAAEQTSIERKNEADEQKVRAQFNEARAREEQARAEQEKAVAITVRDFLQSTLLREANPWVQANRGLARRNGQKSVQADLTVREVLERAARDFTPETVARKFPNQPVVQAEILDTIGETYEGIGNKQKSVTYVEAAHAIRENSLGPHHPTTMASLTNLLFVNLSSGRLPEAVRLMMGLVERVQHVLQSPPNDPGDAERDGTNAVLDAVFGKIEQRADSREFRYPVVKLGIADAVSLLAQLNRMLAGIQGIAKTCEERFGPMHRRTLLSELWVGFCLHCLGKVDRACETYERILARAEGSLPPDDWTLVSLREVLISTYGVLDNNPEKRLALLQQCLETKTRLLGEQHPATLNLLGQLASEHAEKKNWPQAIEIYKKVHASYSTSLGPDNADAIAVLLHLADCHHSARMWPETFDAFDRAYRSQLKTLGADHVDTLTTLHDLATAYRDSGNATQAIEIFERVRRERLRTLGIDHEDTQSTMLKLAGVYRNSGMIPQAVTILEQIRDARILKQGKDHSLTQAVLFTLAATLNQGSKSTEALAILEEVRDVRTRTLGIENEETLEAMHELAEAYRISNRGDEAIRLYEQVSSLREKVLGAENKKTLLSLHNLALTCLNSQQVDRAIQLFEKIRKIDNVVYGEGHVESLTTLHNLASAFAKKRQYDKEEALLLQVLAGRIDKLGQKNLETAKTMFALARCYHNTARASLALPLMEKVHEVRQEIVGPDAEETLMAVQGIGYTYRQMNQVADALPYYEKFLDGRTKLYGPEHDKTLDTTCELGVIHSQLGNRTKSSDYFDRALTIIEKKKFESVYTSRLFPDALAAFDSAKHEERAAAWREKWLRRANEKKGTQTVLFGNELAALGLDLIHRKQWADAERVLRDCLSIREKTQPGAWSTHSTQALLGTALQRQKKFSEAENLLVRGYEGMAAQLGKADMPAAPIRTRLTETLDQLVELYSILDKPELLKKYRDMQAKLAPAKK